MFVMLWPDAAKALNFCCDLDRVALPEPEPVAEHAGDPAPPPAHPDLARLGALTPREKFSQCVNVIFDALGAHPEAYRDVQRAVRQWRDGPLAA